MNLDQLALNDEEQLLMEYIKLYVDSKVYIIYK